MDAPRYRPFGVVVSRTERLCPTFLRITFTGEDLVGFGASGGDQRLKVVLPAPGRGPEALGETCRAWGDDWYARWRALPDAERPLLRTYTVRAARPALGEVDVDFVLHGHGHGHGAGAAAGPASRWAAAARPGDPLVVVGPDRPGLGRAWGREWAPPQRPGRLLLAGDETAVPAVCAVLEELEPEAARRTVAVLEVPGPEDALPGVASGGAQVRWLPRRSSTGGAAPHGSLLTGAVRALVGDLGGPAGGRAGAGAALEDVDVDRELLWDVPASPGDGGPYVWLAGEAGLVRDLRRHLVREAGLPRERLCAMGYWRAGRAEAS